MNPAPGPPRDPTPSDPPAPPAAPPAADVARLVVEEGERLTRMLVGVTRDHATAQDAFQFALTRLLTHGSGVPADGWRAWLYRVAVREAIRLKRRRATETRVHQKLSHGIVPADPTPPPATVVMDQERRAAVRAAVAALPESQRRVVELRTVEGLTFQQIADRTGEPLGTVLWRMRQAVGQLRKTLPDPPG